MGGAEPRRRRVKKAPVKPFASVTAALSDTLMGGKKSVSNCAPPPPPPPQPKVDTKPASDVLAGAMARAASQGTIHPLDTLKVRMQSGKGGNPVARAVSKYSSKYSQLVPPAGASPGAVVQAHGKVMKKALPKIASLYKGVFGAASGAGIAIGTYFAFYGAASNVLARKTTLQPGGIAFVAGMHS